MQSASMILTAQDDMAKDTLNPAESKLATEAFATALVAWRSGVEASARQIWSAVEQGAHAWIREAAAATEAKLPAAGDAMLGIAC